MKYKIESWVLHEVVDEIETDSFEEAKKWWRDNWKSAEDYGEAYCEWYLDGVAQDICKKIELEKERREQRSMDTHLQNLWKGI